MTNLSTSQPTNLVTCQTINQATFHPANQEEEEEEEEEGEEELYYHLFAKITIAGLNFKVRKVKSQLKQSEED